MIFSKTIFYVPYITSIINDDMKYGKYINGNSKRNIQEETIFLWSDEQRYKKKLVKG